MSRRIYRLNACQGRGDGFRSPCLQKEDPRARHLKVLAEELCSLRGNKKLYDISHKIENIVLEKKGIYPMLILLRDCSICFRYPGRFLYRCLAISRISGWVAHILDNIVTTGSSVPHQNTSASITRNSYQLPNVTRYLKNEGILQ